MAKHIDKLLEKIADVAQNRTPVRPSRQYQGKGKVCPAAAYENVESDRRPRTADVAIITAMRDPEGEKVKNAFSGNWVPESREGVVFQVAECEIKGEEAIIVLASQGDIGMVPATILAMKTLQSWQPSLLAMTGICAGVRGKVNIGDIIVGRQVFDYGVGKIAGGKFVPDYTPIALNERLFNLVEDFASRKTVIGTIRERWPTATGRPDTILKVHIGAMGSGAAVIADDDVLKKIEKHKRSLIAIDMEAYGIARAVAAAVGERTKFLIVKGVQDFADQFKSDKFREYAAFVSAEFLRSFLEHVGVGGL